jgi:hypothetical protein
MPAARQTRKQHELAENSSDPLFKHLNIILDILGDRLRAICENRADWNITATQLLKSTRIL